MCVYCVTFLAYLSRGGSLREREAGIVSAPLVGSPALGGRVSLATGACDLERNFLSFSNSRTLRGAPTLRGLPPGPDENHSPDLVRISCCFLHRLHTHITCVDKYKS